MIRIKFFFLPRISIKFGIATLSVAAKALHILNTKNYKSVCEILGVKFINHRLVLEDPHKKEARGIITIKYMRWRVETEDEYFKSKLRHQLWGIPIHKYLPGSVGQIFVKSLSGIVYTCKYNPTYTVYDVKEEITEQTGVPINQLRFIYGKCLIDDMTLECCGVRAGETINLVKTLSGC